jgi:hypothetical protein
MERLLREKTGNPDLELADVFDMIAGTSVGSSSPPWWRWAKSAGDNRNRIQMSSAR